MQDIIQVNNLTKKYKKSDSYAVSDMSFRIAEGEIVGLLGPNGAGKSTLIKMILGVITPTSGTVSVLNQNPLRFRSHEKNQIGVFLGGKSNLIYHLPVLDSVHLFQSIYHVSRERFNSNLSHFAKCLQCTDILKQRVATLSLGQRLRAELLCLFIYEPRLLILDEPTLGLDIEGKRQFRDLLRAMAAEHNTTVLITTHDVNDMQKLCDRILLICDGTKVMDLNASQFDALLEKHNIFVTDVSLDDLPDGVKHIESTGDLNRYLVPVEQGEVVKSLVQNKPYRTLRQESSSLEDLMYEYYS